MSYKVVTIPYMGMAAKLDTIQFNSIYYKKNKCLFAISNNIFSAICNFFPSSEASVWGSRPPRRCGGIGRQNPILPCPHTAETGDEVLPQHEEEGWDTDPGGWWPFWGKETLRWILLQFILFSCHALLTSQFFFNKTKKLSIANFGWLFGNFSKFRLNLDIFWLIMG